MQNMNDMIALFGRKCVGRQLFNALSSRLLEMGMDSSSVSV